MVKQAREVPRPAMLRVGMEKRKDLGVSTWIDQPEAGNVERRHITRLWYIGCDRSP